MSVLGNIFMADILQFLDLEDQIVSAKQPLCYIDKLCLKKKMAVR
jgi:hypothetical protein